MRAFVELRRALASTLASIKALARRSENFV